MEHSAQPVEQPLDAEDQELKAAISRSMLETTISEVLVADFVPVCEQYREVEKRRYLSDAELSRELQAAFDREFRESVTERSTPSPTYPVNPWLTERGKKLVQDLRRTQPPDTYTLPTFGAGPSTPQSSSAVAAPSRTLAPGEVPPRLMPDVVPLHNAGRGDILPNVQLVSGGSSRAFVLDEPIQRVVNHGTAHGVPCGRAATIIGPAPMTTTRTVFRPPLLPPPPPPPNGNCVMGAPLSPVTPVARDLYRPEVVLDGLNVGCSLGGGGGRFFRARGIHLALEYYRGQRIRAIAVLPSNKVEEHSSACADDVNTLWTLFDEKRLFFTPTGESDDNYILSFCMENDANVVSNDNFRRELHTQTRGKEMKKWLASHRIGFSFINNQFTPRPIATDLMTANIRPNGRRRNHQHR